VDDIAAATKRIVEAGGTIVSEPFELPGVGLFATFADTESNVVQIYQDYLLGDLPDD
jgi:predicted enzyme related to lactoylglutathione lyase